ncbi:MAG: putative colanic acid biosynthesis acetyltransferase [Pirellulaceae bacterium]|nr:putative colanic acid biosynthesis acetyltransferase [Pirellulaceae bacterium]
MGDFVDCYCVDQIVIDREATVSQYAYLCTASHDIESPSRDLITKPIHIGRGAWVFSGAFIGMGVSIGEGAIVAARSVVVKDVDAFAVVAGNPSRVIKTRKANWINHNRDGCDKNPVDRNLHISDEDAAKDLE